MRPGIDGPSVYLCVEQVDFRKSISGLSLIVEQSLELNPFEPVLLVFINRKRDKLKILYWERNGFCLWYKSQQQERFKWPATRAASTVVMSSEELNWLIATMLIFSLVVRQPWGTNASSAMERLLSRYRNTRSIPW